MTLCGKNILVTGGDGFIDSALARELVKEKANVIVYDNFSSGDRLKPSGDRRVNINSSQKMKYGDNNY